MPIRTASMKRKLVANGHVLHKAKASGDAATEAALAQERKQLKEEQAKRKANALLPRPSALDRLVRTHHPEPKTDHAKKAHDAHDAKKPKARRSRAEKHAEQAAAIEAARAGRSGKKPAEKKPAK